MYAFVRRNDGHLYTRFWTGATWQWGDQGPPGGVTVATRPNVIASVQVYGGQREMLHAFVGGNDGHLYVNYWDGAQWNWNDQGTPANATVGTAPAVTTFRHEGTDRMYVFVGGNNGHLYVNYWDGAQWNWRHQGTP